MGGCCCKASNAVDSGVEVHVLPSGRSKSSTRGASPAHGRSPSPGGGGQTAVDVTPSAVKVACVVRPLLDFELQKAAANTITLQQPNKVNIPAKPGGTGVNDGAYEFQYNRVYHAASTAASQALYQEMARPVIDQVCKGFNGTILAYGQTGSGKTFTMGTAAGVKDIAARGGSAAVIPQACRQVLQHMREAADKYDMQLKVSFVEIYNESIQDLLNPQQQPGTSSSNLLALRLNNLNNQGNNGSSNNNGSSTPRSVSSSEGAGSSIFASSVASDGGGGSSSGGAINIRETSKGEIVLEGISEVLVHTMDELAVLLEQGNAVRATAAHKLNQHSSRSHAILTLTLEQRARPSAAKQLPAECRYLRSKLHLGDLAGSERAKETGTTGQRFVEGVSINKGLLELGNVINALTEGTARKHIPYRNSKLTRLLQDSLGGNSETLFIACISPADTNRDHTISTLRYASRAMAIKNSLKLNNQMTAEEEVVYLKQVVAELQEENERLRRLMAVSNTQRVSGTVSAGVGGRVPAGPGRISVGA